MKREGPGEFELIAKLFAPLAREMPGAFGLTDDVALLKPRPAHELVLKTDSLIEGVHFLRRDPPQTIGRKALRRALSDLAAKGAEPSCYLLALALPQWPEMIWLEAFADGLAADQKEFGICLAGGETNATPGPLALTVTVVGQVPDATLIRRKGARPGDGVFVSGTIGDAAGGLELAKRHHAEARADDARDYLLSRFRLPEPRLSFGRALRGIASASIDVSDGLVADLGHIASASGVRIAIDVESTPISPALRELWGIERNVAVAAATAGDDYEVAFTAPDSQAEALSEAARRCSTPVTWIGRVTSGHGAVLLDASGEEIVLTRRGYTHF